ncbi:hypothetical protein NBRC10512_004358 [Rhodotorula toruloides]|uniref:Uncharacterized protein n=1 Tax=Rhodotorula toruloides (strain NP11) TaxID=1130832 RepID=M7WXN7_RHOT1|nr:uncharacterized protein RHTO_03100 [Rhodotorula toruloides NP11]EMS25372.1 hypothetical protein RHTO_03100 [Rhodotorula toruloides NP11]
MQLVTAFSTPTAREKTSALMRWPAIAVARVEEERANGLGHITLEASDLARLPLSLSLSPSPHSFSSLLLIPPSFESESLPLSSASPRASTPPAPPPRRHNSTVVKDLVDDALVRSGSRLTSSSSSPSSGSSCSASTGVEGRAVSTPAWSVERRSTAPTRFAFVSCSQISRTIQLSRCPTSRRRKQRLTARAKPTVRALPLDVRCHRRRVLCVFPT